MAKLIDAQVDVTSGDAGITVRFTDGEERTSLLMDRATFDTLMDVLEIAEDAMNEDDDYDEEEGEDCDEEDEE
jgi:hypothetical protein